MIKNVILVIVSVIVSVAMSAQTKLDAAQQAKIVEKIDKCASGMNSMQCDFTQSKTMKMLSRQMVSKGVMFFKRKGKVGGEALRWQYTSPYDYTFIMNGSKVSIKSAKSSQTVDTQKNKMFRQITNVIVNSITGGCLRSSSDFKVEIFKNGNAYSAKLLPKKKEIKQIYSSIEIFFNPSLTMVSSVRMTEKTGDVTTVTLNNVKVNGSINEKVFDIN